MYTRKIRKQSFIVERRREKGVMAVKEKRFDARRSLKDCPGVRIRRSEEILISGCGTDWAKKRKQLGVVMEEEGSKALQF